MAKKEKNFFKNYPNDVKFSRSIEDVKKHIEFAEPIEEKISDHRKIFDLRLILSILIMIFVITPLSFFMGYLTNDNGIVPIDEYPDENSAIQTYLKENFEVYLENAIVSKIMVEDLEIAFYVGKSEGIDYLIFYIKSLNEYSVSFVKGINEVVRLNSLLLDKEMYEIAYSDFELEIVVSSNSNILETVVIEFELNPYLNLLK